MTQHIVQRLSTVAAGGDDRYNRAFPMGWLRA